MIELYRTRFEQYGHGAAEQAIVGLGGQVFMADTGADAEKAFRPYFDNAPVYGHGPSLEEFTATTPLTVGTPEQVIERTLGREVVPVLRTEFERRRPSHVPSEPPTHASLVAAGAQSPYRSVAPVSVTTGAGE